MDASIRGFRARARADAEVLLEAISAAEEVIVTTLERECEALRAGHLLAAKALHTRFCDATRLYLDAIRSARASLWTIETVLPGARATLEERRGAFLSILKVELAVLAAARVAAGEEDSSPGFDVAPVDPPRRGSAASRR
jgi:hypothetical protein